MALTKVGGGVLRQPIDVGIITATSVNASGIVTAGTVQVGSATTIHSTGIDLGSGNITSHNINSTGIITATSFVGPVTGDLTGNVTGNVTGNLTGDVTGNTSGTAGGLTGSPSITVTDVTATGNVSIGGTLTYEDVTNIDSVGIITAQSDVLVGRNLSVTSGISTVKSLDYAAIDSTISDTAVDVFIYDTSKDSDGGAWRKRTQHTSWYNETLNTSTRGSRREFPAVAVIVMQEGTLTIYDGDDPDLPMWMVFTDNNDTGSLFASAKMLSCRTTTSIFMLNGMFVCGGRAPYHDAVTEINFLTDSAKKHMNNGYYYNTLNISQRESTGGYYTVTSGTPGIVNNLINDVAMTVLPNAPIDDTTGLPVPTIAVATDGGVSVINNDGTVADIVHTVTLYNNYVHFIRPDLLTFSQDNTALYKWTSFVSIPTSDQSNTYQYNNATYAWYANYWGTGSTNILISTPTVDPENLGYTAITPMGSDMISFGSSKGLGMGTLDDSPPRMVSYATTSYNSGYMVGDIKGAFLSDTDATNATDSNVVTNGTFDSNTNSWSGDSGASISWDSGGFASVGNGGGDNTYAIQQTGILVSGAKYRITGRVQPSMSGSYEFRVRAGGSSTQWNMTSGLTNGQWYSFDTGIITADGTKLEIGSLGGTITNFYLDDVYVWKLEEEDRSLNNKGLEVHGTVTKSAVATGADLVAYSGFSSSNVLFQPYNSDLDPGTGDYSFMLWFKCSPVSGEQMIMRRFSNVSVTGGMMMRVVASTSVLQWYVRDTSSSATTIQSPNAIDDGNWHCAVGTRQGSTANLYLDGVLVTTQICSANSHNPGTTAGLVIGAEETVGSAGTYANPASACSLTLVRYSLSAPSAEQVKKMYDDEKVLFQENAKATLYGSSDAVTALGYDEDTELLHVGTSAGRSDFQGLRRINNTTTAVTTAISASDDLIAEQ